MQFFFLLYFKVNLKYSCILFKYVMNDIFYIFSSKLIETIFGEVVLEPNFGLDLIFPEN